jgi:hypothetical protein
MNLTPEGTYAAKLAGMKFGTSTNGAEVMEYIIDVHVGTNDVRRKSISNYFTGGAAQYTEERLRTMDFNGNFDEPKCGSWCYDDGFEVYVKHETYDDGKGQGSRVFEKWNFSRGSRTKPPAPDSASNRSQRWRAKYGATAPGPTGPAPSAAPPATPRAGPPPAPAPAAFVHTKETAWDAWVNERGAKLTDAEWQKAVLSIGRGRHESQFTSADWSQVAELAVVPF